MKTNLSVFTIILITMLTACQPATPPPPITAAQDVEFSLAEDQTATITDTGLAIRLIGVAGDERCPSEIECAMSGPVSISLSVQQGNGDPANINLQVFTGNDGRAPGGQFEGIKDRITVDEYSIQVMGVMPYPASPSKPIKSSDYRVTLAVTQK